MNDEIKINISNGSISFINNGIGFSQFGVAREILDLITNLQEEIIHLRQNKARTLEYIENNRIREKCIVDVNTLEGLLNE